LEHLIRCTKRSKAWVLPISGLSRILAAIEPGGSKTESRLKRSSGETDGSLVKENILQAILLFKEGGDILLFSEQTA
jgi:hypothetical protein